MERLSRWLTWQLVVLLGLGLAATVAIALLAPPGSRELLFGAEGLVATLVAYWMRSPRDRARDLPPTGLGPPRLPTMRPPSRDWDAEDDDLESSPTSPQSPLAIDRRDRPPGERRRGSVDVITAAAVVVAAALIAACAATLSGCGSAVEVNARVATALDVVSAQSADIIRDQRRVALERAGRAVLDAGGDEAAMVAAVQAESDAWDEVVDVHGTFDATRAGYSAAVVAAHDEGTLTMSTGAPLASSALDAYERLRRLIARRTRAVVPEIPRFVREWVESQIPEPGEVMP